MRIKATQTRPDTKVISCPLKKCTWMTLCLVAVAPSRCTWREKSHTVKLSTKKRISRKQSNGVENTIITRVWWWTRKLVVNLCCYEQWLISWINYWAIRYKTFKFEGKKAYASAVEWRKANFQSTTVPFYRRYLDENTWPKLVKYRFTSFWDCLKEAQ